MHPSTSNIESKILSETTARTAFSHILKITNFGVRYAGSEADNKTIKYLEGCFKDYGLNVEIEAFKALCFEEKSSKLQILSPVKKEIDIRAMAYSTPTPEDGITTEIVHITEEAKGELTGKIAIFDRDPKLEKDCYWKEVNEIAKQGAEAAIMANHKPWIFIATLESGFFEAEKRFLPIEPKPIPAAITSSLDAQYIYHLMSKGPVEGSLQINSIVEEKETYNVRAFIEGGELKDERIIICAHHDTEGTLGANDNASGLAVMLELARILSKYKPKRTIEFLATGAEEVCSIGSWNYCNMHKKDLENIKAVLNVDMIGVGGPLYLIREGRWPDKLIKTPEWLYNFVADIAHQLNYEVKFGVCELGTSDEGRFLDAGVPALFIWKPDDEYYHSPHDVPDRVDPNTLKVVADIVGVAVWKLANTEDLSEIIKRFGG